jgi:Gpi18-like mannosyltransferase
MYAGSAQLSKVAAQLLANMSANEGLALHAVWIACFPSSFTRLAAFHCESLPLLLSIANHRVLQEPKSIDG